ncbi:hypothetical protein [Amycolatopsis sp. NPDC049868]|uniref:hypothetical protein n=1 Tax=Amycolatopsis sp. NPDC049868 TaxID=3363934 RepID=UPI00378780D8
MTAPTNAPVRAEEYRASFPAVIEPARHHGLWVRPRLRRDVAEAVCLPGRLGEIRG